MTSCALCHKRYKKGNGSFFSIPKDVETRNKWSEICGKKFAATARLCGDHFLPSSIICAGGRTLLLPNAQPFIQQSKKAKTSSKHANKTSNTKLEHSNDTYSQMSSWFDPSYLEKKFVAQKKSLRHQSSQAKVPIDVNAPKYPQNEVFKNPIKEFAKKINKNIMPPQLEEEPIIQIPETSVIKMVSCAQATQTNTRLCGLVETSDLVDAFRFNCFYCSKQFPLEKWTDFINHVKKVHSELEEAFKTSTYISNEHDYTPVSLPQPTPAVTAIRTVYDTQSQNPLLEDPLGTAQNPFESEVSNSSNYYANNSKKRSNSSLKRYSQPKSTKKRYLRKNVWKHKSKAGKLYSKYSKEQPSKITALSRCLKRTISENIIELESNDEYDVNDESEPNGENEIVDHVSTEIAFQYTPSHIVDCLLDNMKNYPVLWQFDNEPFNEDFYEAVEDLCRIINNKFSLNIDNIKMRRSINRILRFYCYLFPNTNVEQIDEFTCYYDKCATFLPSSVTEIAYARCSHCYVCYTSDFDLKLHLSEEHRYLQWPYKCLQCKECFSQCDELELHKNLPHYDEIFRCEPCRKSFFRRHVYKKHIVEHHSIEGNKPGKYKCDICDKSLESMGGLRTHKVTHGEKKYKCHLCAKSYHENSRLKLHLKMHLKEYDFMCEICGKEFFTQSALKVHTKTHTREKVACNICNLRLRKSSLSRHLRTVHVVLEGVVETIVKRKDLHYTRLRKTNQIRKRRVKSRIYRCRICDLSFENCKLLEEHNKDLHSEWPCKMCNTKFNLKFNLKRHYRRKHKLHSLQVYKLVEENDDLNEVLALDTEIAKKYRAKNHDAESIPKSNITSPVKTELFPDEMYFEEEKLIHISIIHDEIMKAEDGETEDIGIDYVDDMFIDF